MKDEQALGKLSAAYESNGDPAAISSGIDDAGGKSYGMFQLSSNMGSVQHFIDDLMSSEDVTKIQIGKALQQHPIGSTAFDNEWRRQAKSKPVSFAIYQHQYIKRHYYDVAIDYLKAEGFHMDNHSYTLPDVIWSRAVQYGPHQIVSMLEDALRLMEKRLELKLPNLSYIDHLRFDWDLIVAIYDVCMSYEWNHGPSKDALNHRFQEEKEEAILALEAELGI